MDVIIAMQNAMAKRLQAMGTKELRLMPENLPSPEKSVKSIEKEQKKLN
jgi:hypothetical protein